MKTRTDLTARLLQLPTLLRAAEEALLEATGTLTRAKCYLEEKEASLQLDGAPGKNETERKSWVRLSTMKEHSRVEEATAARDRAALEVRCLGFELRALEAVSRLLAGGVGDGAGEGEGGAEDGT